MKSVIFGATVLMVVLASAAEARNHLRIVSSPGDFVYTSKVAESFSREYRQPAPVIRRTGSRTTIREFCAGIGVDHPDIVSLPRPMQQAEVDECRGNGVKRVTQIKVGYEAVVLARQRGAFRFDVNKVHLFRALAKEVPIHGRIVPNPYQKWSDIDPFLPPIPIRVIGPRADTDIHQAFMKLVMDEACRTLPALTALDPHHRDRICTTFRSDGAFRSATRGYRDTVRLLERDSSRIAIMPYSVYEEWDEVLAAVQVDSVAPNPVTVAQSEYPIICPRFVYIKTQHYNRVPGLLEFVVEYTSDRAWGPDGYLIDDGLIPMTERDRQWQRANAIGFTPMRR